MDAIPRRIMFSAINHLGNENYKEGAITTSQEKTEYKFVANVSRNL